MTTPVSRYRIAHHDIGPWCIPLGGCGRFGANLTLYGSAGYWIAVDCGLTLHDDAGISRVRVPDLRALAELDIRVQALLITHGHEDHIGAIPTLWKALNCPIYATPHALRLIAAKFTQQERWPVLKPVTPLLPMTFGPFTAEWVPVTHSLPEAQGLIIEVAGRRLYHTGDWKLDPFPEVGPVTAEARLRALGRAGVDVVIGDSTNATVPGSSRSEREVAEALRRAVATQPGRVVAVCFASNIARIRSLVLAGQRSGRQAALLGRSLSRHVASARAGDYLTPELTLLTPWELGFLPASAQLWLATGSQGEPRAALERLLQDRHPELTLAAGDTVLFSSRTIPGNEDAVARLKAGFRARGIHVLCGDETPALHASGHPAQHDLETLYHWLRPEAVLPVHGERWHQQAHADLAETLGCETLIPADGDVIALTRPLRRLTRVSAGLVDPDVLAADH